MSTPRHRPAIRRSLVADCSLPIVRFLQTIDHGDPEDIPSWEQLSCYTGGLRRQPQPSVFIQASDRPPLPVVPGPGDNPPSAWQTLVAGDAWDAEWAPYTTIEGGYPVSPPPYQTMYGNVPGPFYPLTAAQWDEKLRALMAFGIYQKQAGKQEPIVYFHSPALGDEPYRSFLPGAHIHSRETFLAWWDDTYVPERVALARMAEQLDAEDLMPWDVEAGMMVRSHGEGWLDALPKTEQVALAQELMDRLLAALRPVFSGRLTVAIYDSYAAVGDEWSGLDVSGWDRVNFSFFTQGDLAFTEAYLDRQIAGYMEIVARSRTHGQPVPWTAGEVTVEGDQHRVLLRQDPNAPAFEDIEADLYDMVFSKLAAAPVKPTGIALTVGFIETPAAETLVRQKLAAIKAHGGFVPGALIPACH